MATTPWAQFLASQNRPKKAVKARVAKRRAAPPIPPFDLRRASSTTKKAQPAGKPFVGLLGGGTLRMGGFKSSPTAAPSKAKMTPQLAKAIAKRVGSAASAVYTGATRWSGKKAVAAPRNTGTSRKSTPAPPRRTAKPPPVGGGSGGGGATGAAGSAAGAGRTTRRAASGSSSSSTSKTNPIDTLFKPLTDEMASQKQRNADLREKARIGLEAFNKWAMDSVNQGQANYRSTMDNIRANTSANLQAIQGNIGKFSGGAGADTGLAGAAGITAAQQINALRAGQMASDTGSAGSFDAAIAGRLAQQQAQSAAQAAGFQSVQDALLNSRDDAWNKANAELMFNVGKVKADDLASQRSAASDAYAAQLMAGDKAAARQLDWARLGLDQKRAATDAAYKKSQIALNRAKALDAKFKNKGGMTYAQLYDRVKKLRQGGHYDDPAATPEAKYQHLSNVLSNVVNLVNVSGLPKSYIKLVMNDVFTRSVMDDLAKRARTR